MPKNNGNTSLDGAGWLFMSAVIVKILGVIYKIPLNSVLGTIGKSYYSLTFNLFVPVYSVSLAGLPVAISKTVSKYAVLGRYKDVKNTFRASLFITVLTGISGTAFLFLIAQPYVVSVNNHNALYGIYIIAPSVLFCCVMSAYKGYYNGLCSMKITAVSEIIEAVCKMVFGLMIAKIIINYGLSNALPGNNVFGLFIKEDTTQNEIMNGIYPFAAAGGIAGVTVGTFASLLYLFIKKNFCREKVYVRNISAENTGVFDIVKELINISVPVIVSTLVFNFMNIVDVWTIQNRLSFLIDKYPDEIYNLYSYCLGNVNKGDWQNFLYGAYETAVDFRNIIPSLTMAFGIGAIPVLSSAWTVKDRNKVTESIETVIKICMLISLPLGLGTALFSKNIIGLLYSGNGDIMSAVNITSKIIRVFGISAFVISVSQPLTYMLQAIGKTRITVISVCTGAVIKAMLNFVLMSDVNINIYGASIGTAVCFSVICIIDLIAVVKYCNIKINFRSVFVKPLICSVISCFSGWGIYYFTGKFSGNDTLNFIIGTGFAVNIYIILLFVCKIMTKSDIIMLPKGENICKILAKYDIIE